MEEFCLLLNDDEIVAAEAPGVQIDQPEVQPLLSIESDIIVLKPILLDPYQPVDPSSGRLLSQSHKEVIHKFRRDLSEIGVELPSMESMSEAFEQMKLIQDVMANKEKFQSFWRCLLTKSTCLPHLLSYQR
ncbi:unnamed protein product [Microthlaspi erraticum]|uniref:Uncharacterized protein n=1 Tax=Microthlaspi erraticum TaxID=1685480 RepID=A0A6D2KCF4_9BRAS|nr:unnamed protein product [Microthlaspi erraticum]